MGMGLTGFLQQYVRPSRWWRRHKTVQVTVWPRFLAQWLCPHLPVRKQMVAFDITAKTKISLCLDCHKQVLEPNDCVHAEVRGHMYETEGARLVPRTFTCLHCHVELQPTDLPEGVQISHLNIEAR